MSLGVLNWGLVREMSKVQKLQEENASLKNEIQLINSEKNLYLKDIDAITRAKIKCQKELTEVRANFDLRSDQNEKVLREKIAVLNKKNKQLEEKCGDFVSELFVAKYCSGPYVSDLPYIQKSSKGGKTNKKIKSKRRHTKKRF